MRRNAIDTCRFPVRHDDPHRRGEGLYLVQSADRFRPKQVVLRFARYFRREFGYDFVQFDPRSMGHGEPEEAFIFVDARHELAFGAAGFVKPGDRWVMTWIWLHPYFRGAGHFTEAMPEFVARYGRFAIDPPYSRSMEAFVKAHPEHGVLSPVAAEG